MEPQAVKTRTQLHYTASVISSQTNTATKSKFGPSFELLEMFVSNRQHNGFRLARTIWSMSKIKLSANDAKSRGKPSKRRALSFPLKKVN